MGYYDKSTISITYTRHGATYLLADSQIDGEGETDANAFLQPHPHGLSEMTDWEHEQLKRLCAAIPDWLADGVGRVYAYEAAALTSSNPTVVKLRQALAKIDAARDSDNEANAVAEFLSAVSPARWETDRATKTAKSAD